MADNSPHRSVTSVGATGFIGLLIGALYVGNGAFMLAAPEGWYWAVPGVAETGGFNPHFIRDIGIVYILTGAAFVFGAFYSSHRKVLWSAAAFWHLGHALFHFWEVLVGICGPEALVRDFAGVTLPAIIGLMLAALEWRKP